MSTRADSNEKQGSTAPVPGKEKIRLKFRVSAFDGVVDGIPEPQWTEKWGVGLFDYEEFHVTDQLLKLPFQENPPKTVCIFSIADEGLRFRMLDSDRKAKVNAVEKTEAIVRIGDKIQIGETLTLEVLLAPKAPAAESEPSLTGTPTVVANASEPQTQTQTRTQNAQTRLSPVVTEAPTLLTTSAPPIDAPSISAGLLDGKEEQADGPSFPDFSAPPSERDDGPTLTLSAQEPTSETRANSDYQGVFGGSKSIEIEEPTIDRIRPDLKPKGGLESFLSEKPIELAKAPHSRKDTSLSPRVNEDGPSFDPVYASPARLNASEPSLSERLMAVVAKVLRRDDLGPPREKFPLDDFLAETPKPAIASDAAPKPWTPAADSKRSYFEEPKIELDMRPFERAAERNEKKGSRTDTAKPWIPEASTAGARMRGRALVFLLASGITLVVLAVGYTLVRDWLARREAAGIEESIANIRQDSFDRGIPIEMIEEKVRRMKRRRR